MSKRRTSQGSRGVQIKLNNEAKSENQNRIKFSSTMSKMHLTENEFGKASIHQENRGDVSVQSLEQYSNEQQKVTMEARKNKNAKSLNFQRAIKSGGGQRHGFGRK